MAAPVRIQLKRTKGWKMPANTVKVDRTTKWGNPFSATKNLPPGRRIGPAYIAVPTVEDAVDCFRQLAASEGPYAQGLRKDLPELRGLNLACWCRPGSPCHADVLLELANTPEPA